MAQARHPRAGTGTGGYHGGYRHGGHYGYHHGGYHGYYRPYGHAAFYFGWPYYYSGWWPYASAAYYDPAYYAPPYGYGDDAGMTAPPAEDGRSEPDRRGGSAVPNTGRVRLEVRPNDASVYVDDEFWGSTRETKSLILRAGRHTFELVRPGFATARREVDVVSGEASDVLVELERL